MRLYANTAGEILCLLRIEEAMHRFPSPPDGTAGTLEFDMASNQALVADLACSTDPYRLTGGTLHRDGVAVTIHPESLATRERRQVREIARYIKGYDRTSTTVDRDRAQLEALSRAVLILGRVVLRELEGA